MIKSIGPGRCLGLSLFLGFLLGAHSWSMAQRSGPKYNAQDTLQFNFQYFEAMKEKLHGNYGQATLFLQKCIKILPGSSAPYYELARLYRNGGKALDALPYAQEAVRLDPDNKWYRILVAEVYKDLRQYSKAADEFVYLSKTYPQDLEFKFEGASLLVQSGRSSEALALLESAEKQVGGAESILLQIKDVYLKMGKVDKAAATVRRLADAYPQNQEYLVMLAELYRANDMEKKAQGVIEEILKTNPNNGYAHLYLARSMQQKGKGTEAFEHLKKAVAAPDLGIDTKIQVLIGYFERIQDTAVQTEAMELGALMVQAHPHEAKAYSIYGDFLYHSNRSVKALEVYQLALDLDPSRFEIWRQMIVIASELEDFRHMHELSAEAIELFPNQGLLYLFNGLALNQIKEHQKAVETLESGIQVKSKNSALQAQLYAQLGEAHHSLEQHQKSDQAFEASLKLDPDNANTLNNYSYYLSLRKERLNEALAMSGRSNTLSPGNASYQDTYAWILYQLGRYEEARIWMEKALASADQQNPTLLEHYGDILFKLGLRDEAVFNWQLALDKGPRTELLQKKVQDKKLYE